MLLLLLAAVLQALAPSLLEARLGAEGFASDRKDDLLSLLQLLLPTMHLVGLSAGPALLNSATLPHGIDIAPYAVSTYGRLGTLTLLRSATHSAQQPPSATLTRLNLLRPDHGPSSRGFRHHPLPLLAPFTAHLRELHVNFHGCEEAFLVPVAALPPLLTALFCTNATLLLDGGEYDAQRCTARLADTEAAGPVAQPAAASCSSSRHAPSPPGQPAGCLPRQTAGWQGLQQLHTLQSMVFDSMSPFAGGGLPDLLRGTPNLKHLVCHADFRQGGEGDATRLTGCAQRLTHLQLLSVFGVVVVPEAVVEQVCEWVGSLRHLRQLHLNRNVPEALLSQVRPIHTTPHVFS
jgi:hypothetical protein